MGTWNSLAVGDNLVVLADLAAQGARFDVAYLDPPYNTGSALTYRDRTPSHEEWVASLRPRLEAVRAVLAPTGAVFVSIDDHEVARLRLLLDEVFGEDQFLAQVVVNLNPKGRQLGPGFATSHEYLLVYAVDRSACALDASTPDTVDPADFPHHDEASGRAFRLLPLRNTNKKFNPTTARTLHYPLVDVYQRDWLHAGRRKKLRTVWLAEEVGSTDTAVAELKALVGPVFASPKPTGLLRRVLGTYPDDARVLDPFAGSGTTGHAVAMLNAEDGGRRTCLSINHPESVPPGSPAAAAGLATVADIPRARLTAVAEAYGGGLALR